MNITTSWDEWFTQDNIHEKTKELLKNLTTKSKIIEAAWKRKE